MAVPQITTVQQAYDYAKGSAKSAANGVCPGQAAVYTELANQVANGQFGPMTGLLVGGLQIAWEEGLSYADEACRNSYDYKTSIPVTTSGGTIGSQALPVDPSTGGAAPAGVVSAGIGSGGSALLWLAVGVGAFLLWSKSKKGGGKRRAKARRKPARRRRRRLCTTTIEWARTPRR